MRRDPRFKMSRRSILVAACLAILPGPAVAETFWELDTRRHGATYSVYPMNSADPADCAAACAADPSCRAWTYVHPGIRGPEAVCELKSAIVRATPSPCCISGVAVPEAATGATSIDDLAGAPLAQGTTRAPTTLQPGQTLPTVIGPRGVRTPVEPRVSSGVLIYSAPSRSQSAGAREEYTPESDLDRADEAGLAGG